MRRTGDNQGINGDLLIADGGKKLNLATLMEEKEKKKRAGRARYLFFFSQHTYYS